MKFILTFVLLMMSSIMLHSAPAFICSDSKSAIESKTETNASDFKEERSINFEEDTNHNDDQCSSNSRIELRGRLILEKKYKLYT